MTDQTNDRYAQADTGPTPHEQEVAKIEEAGDTGSPIAANEDAQQASGRDAEQDLADDMSQGDESTR